MKPQQEKEFRAMVEKDLKRMSLENNLAWMNIASYIRTEFAEGKSDFRIHINENGTFYIHPIDKDGKTFDGHLHL